MGESQEREYMNMPVGDGGRLKCGCLFTCYPGQAHW